MNNICPNCNKGTMQETWVPFESDYMKAYGCNSCQHGYWERVSDGSADIKPATNKQSIVWTQECQDDITAFHKSERDRLIEKLDKIENLSKYAWEQVKRNPEEAEQLFKMIYDLSK